jgi:hypothetical protein
MPASAERRIELLEVARQRFQRRIGDGTNHPQRVIRPDPLLKICVHRSANRSSRGDEPATLLPVSNDMLQSVDGLLQSIAQPPTS